MHLSMTVVEAIALATAKSPMPPIVQRISAGDDTIHADLDPLEVITGSIARLLAAAAGPIAVAARFAGFSHGVATFEVTAMARGLPAHKLLPLLIDRVTQAIAENPAAAGIVEVRTTENDPLVLIDIQAALDARGLSLQLTALDLREATIFAEAAVTGS